MDEKEWTIALYHGGEFQDIPHKSYVGGELGNFDHISYDYMSLPVFWEMAEKLKKYPEPRMCKFYYRLPGLPLKEGLRAIESDADVLKMLESHMRLPIITAFLVAPQPEPLDQLEPPLALDQFINDAHEEDCEMGNAGHCDMGTEETTESGLNTVEEEPQVNVPDPMFEYDSAEENCVDDETRDKNDDEDWVEQEEVIVTSINFGDREEDQRVDSDLEDLIDIGITVDGHGLPIVEDGVTGADGVTEAEGLDDSFVEEAAEGNGEATEQDFDLGNEADDASDEVESVGADSEELISLDGSDSDEDNKRPRYPVYQKTKPLQVPILKIGMKFTNAAQFREALRKHVVLSGFDFVFKKNEGDRVTCGCFIWLLHFE